MSGGRSDKPNPRIVIEAATPTGDIHDANPPLPVRVRLWWKFDRRPVVIQTAWAMAWTRTEVLVYFRLPSMKTATTVWLPVRQVRHRDSPIREAD